MTTGSARRILRRPGADAVLLAPGAGSDRDHPTLVALESALVPLAVARMDFPYRREGRRVPDRASRLVASIDEEVASLADRARTTPGRIVLGGRSMGGRMCSMAVAGGLPAAGLVLISYPLHPPGRPERLRTEHFGRVRVPCLFVSGDRDPFGTPDELARASEAIPAPVELALVPGGRHDLSRADDQVVALVVGWLASQLGVQVAGGEPRA